MFRRQGENLDYVCTEDVVRGDVIVINDVIGIAATSATTGDLIAVYMEGVFALPKGEEELKQGQKVYYDKTTKKITATAPTDTEAATESLAEGQESVALAADDKVLAGIVWEDAAASAGKVFVKIN